MCKIDKINDEVEKQKHIDLMDDIIDRVNEYDYCVDDYNKLLLKEEMKSRGILFTNSRYNVSQLKEKWEKAFTQELTEEIKDKIYFDQYMWHVFSNNKLESKVEGTARSAFDQKKKNSVFVFYQRKEEAFYIECARNLKASDFDLDEDVYILDADYKWTYVHTHESTCGPYFYSNCALSDQIDFRKSK